MDLISKFYNSSDEEIEETIENINSINKENENSNNNNFNIINKNFIQEKELKNRNIQTQLENQEIGEKENNNIPLNEYKTNNVQEAILNNINNKLKSIEYAPEVNVQDLILKKDIDKYEKFNSGFFVPLKTNHLTGYINYHTMNDFNFNEQYYNFSAYGFAQDPTDFSGNKLIGDVKKLEDPNIPNSVFDNNTKTKESRKKLKMKRFKYGDAGSGEFMGPWAIYEGEEIFKNMSGELTEEQKDILKQIQEKKQKKLEEDKAQETSVLNVKLLKFIFFILKYY